MRRIERRTHVAAIGLLSRSNTDIFQDNRTHPETPLSKRLIQGVRFVVRVVVGRSRQDPSVDLFVIAGIEHENPEKADLL